MNRKITLPAILVCFFLHIAVSFSQERGLSLVKVSIHDTVTTLYKESHALLIGENNYTNGPRSLFGVESDIQRVKHLLEDNGFTGIKVLMNPDHDALRKEFNHFIANSCQVKDSRVVFYFAGHGWTQNINGTDMGYLLPSDCPLPDKDLGEFLTRAIPMDEIEIFAKKIQSKHALFLFDACFSGAIFTPYRYVPEIISYKINSPVRQFITSGSGDETVPDRSIFCDQLIEAFYGSVNKNADLNNDGFITGTELGDFLQAKVINYSHDTQHPQFGKIRDPHLDKGDIIFVLKNPGKPAITEVNEIKPDFRPAGVGNLELTFELTGYLFVDGNYVQYISTNSQWQGENMQEGKHTIKITGEETTEETVTVVSGQTVKRTIKPKKIKPVIFDNFDMIYVTGGTFKMGSDRGTKESPIHDVTVDTFYIGQYEVTQKQWQDIMGSNPSKFNDCFNCPVENVSWDDVQEFLIKLNSKTGRSYRLPTEAEWEFAAGGGNAGKGYEYCGSNNPDEVGWYKMNSKDKTHPVGQKKPNELNIYDMSGNVWEWCSDYFSRNYYDSSPKNNPHGPTNGSFRVLRGGSRDGNPFDLRVKSRGNTLPNDRSSFYGFRTCLSK